MVTSFMMMVEDWGWNWNGEVEGEREGFVKP